MSDKKTKEGQEQQKQEVPLLNLAGPFEKLIPKLCTGVFFQVVHNKVIITLTYNEGTDEKQVTVIERVVVDLNHANQISETLKKVLEDAEKVQQDTKEIK